MIVRKEIDLNAPLTEEQEKTLEALRARSVIPDDEYPEFSKTDLLQFKKISDDRRNERQKQTVTLRLSPQAIQKARSLGKGYTSVLSRILENALNNPETVKRNL